MVINEEFFHSVYGQNLITELGNIVHRPFVVVTMEELWPMFKDDFRQDWVETYFVNTMQYEELEMAQKQLPVIDGVVGIGGGRALDVAKFFAWKKNLPLFQAPTITSVNAAFTHRPGLRFASGGVDYIGWAIPEAVYIDYNVVQEAPAYLNRAGAGDVLCIHTALKDWKLAKRQGKTKSKPYNKDLADKSKATMNTVINNAGEINAITKKGIEVLMEAHRWTGTTYHNCGWNQRYIEGSEHFFAYNLENVTGQEFIHGEVVTLGILLMSLLHGEKAVDEILQPILDVGIRIKLEDLGISWNDIQKTLETLPDYVEKEDWLYYTVINEGFDANKLTEKAKAKLSPYLE